jgi:hypothetical protein
VWASNLADVQITYSSLSHWSHMPYHDLILLVTFDLLFQPTCRPELFYLQSWPGFLSVRVHCSSTVLMRLTVIVSVNTGQVVNVLRESRLPTISGYKPQQTSHVILPTHIRSGITIFTTLHSAAYERLVQVTEDLPLALSPPTDSCSASSRPLQHAQTHQPLGRVRRRKKCAMSNV